MAELLCDMDYVKAEYERAATSGSSSAHFSISLRIGGDKQCMFEIDVNNSARFVAEMEVLISLMRARTLKAQLSDDEE